MPHGTDPFGKTVLLVDSNAEARERRARRLRFYGISVQTAANLQEACGYFRGNRFDLVLVAPRENPEEALQLQREIKRLHPEQRVGFCVGPPHYISFTFGQNVVPMPVRSSTWADKVKVHLASA